MFDRVGVRFRLRLRALLRLHRQLLSLPSSDLPYGEPRPLTTCTTTQHLQFQARMSHHKNATSHSSTSTSSSFQSNCRFPFRQSISLLYKTALLQPWRIFSRSVTRHRHVARLRRRGDSRSRFATTCYDRRLRTAPARACAFRSQVHSRTWQHVLWQRRCRAVGSCSLRRPRSVHDAIAQTPVVRPSARGRLIVVRSSKTGTRDRRSKCRLRQSSTHW